MARRLRQLYRWEGRPGQQQLQQAGVISEAKLRAWEYHEDAGAWDFASGSFHDTVRRWKTSRPDLRVPEELLVGDFEQTLQE